MNSLQGASMFYTYVYRDPSRGNEPIYVGKGQKGRAYEHLEREDKHPFSHRLRFMKQNGIEPIINVVPMPSEEMALLCEVDAIRRFGRKDLGLGPLLNLTDGGEGVSGAIRTKEWRANLGAASKGKPSPQKGATRTAAIKAKISEATAGEKNGFFGKTHTDEALAKMTQKGKCLGIIFISSTGNSKKFRLGDIIPNGYIIKHRRSKLKYSITSTRELVSIKKS